METMERLKNRITLYANFDWQGETEISQIRKDLDEVEKQGATYLDLNAGYESISIEAVFYQQESDEEYKVRIDKENEKQEQIKQKELADFETIKQKELEEFERIKNKYNLK